MSRRPGNIGILDSGATYLAVENDDSCSSKDLCLWMLMEWIGGCCVTIY